MRKEKTFLLNIKMEFDCFCTHFYEEDELLTREIFKKEVFKRDNNKCVVCKEPAIDAHHILERKLFNDGGYYLGNGVSLCSHDHFLAERTELDCDYLRKCAGIKSIILPEHFVHDTDYDKWGNPILPNKTRLKGELFYEEQVQKILPDSIKILFSELVKFPRTYHLPWSPNLQNDDRMLESLDGFKNEDIVVTVKMDGENTSMYRDAIHARALSFAPRKDRSWISALHGRIKYDIPRGWRICGENLFAKHSIHYKDLPSYFMMFSIWNEKNVCLSWKETEEWAELLGLTLVPIVHKGKIEDFYTSIFSKDVYKDRDDIEGYVIRVARCFPYIDYKRLVGKYVRKNHVRTDEHWTTQPIVPNILV